MQLNKNEVAILWEMKKGILISIVVGILVAITANLEVYWKPWKWDQNCAPSEVSIVTNN